MLKQHLIRFQGLYILLISWAAFGAFLPSVAAVAVCSISYLLVLRTKDLSLILLSTLALLLMSDSRADMFQFAAQAKIITVSLLLLFVLLNWRDLSQYRNEVFKFFFPFLAFGVLSTFWSVEPFLTLQKSASYGLVFFVIPILYKGAYAQNDRIGLDMISFVMVFLAIGLAINFVFPDFTSLVGRYRGLLGNPNGLGIFLTVFFPFYFLTMKQFGFDIYRMPYLRIFLVLFLISVSLTGSRTTLLALGLFVIFNYIKYLSNFVTLVLFFAFIMSYEYLLTQLPSIINFVGLGEYFRLDTLEEGSGRFIAWNFAWERINERFFMGGGFGYTEYIYKQYYTELSNLGHQGNAHNSFLTIWIDTGLIGLFLMVMGLIRTTLAALKTSRYTLPVLYSILFSSFFESWLSGSLNPFTSVFLVVVTLLLSESEKPSGINESSSTLQ